MRYEAELNFLREVLRKCRVESTLADLSQTLANRKEAPLHEYFTVNLDQNVPLRELLPPILDGTVYRICDSLGCRFLLIPLKELGADTVLFIGPYLNFTPTAQQIMELAEEMGIQPSEHKSLEKFYSSIPLIPEGSHFFTALEVFAEKLWGPGSFDLEDIDNTSPGTQPPLNTSGNQEERNLLWSMHSMELRYGYENELMEAVSRGQSHKAEQLLGGFSTMRFEQRLSDPLRNLKNYCIIMNTLLRKAAERGGVHPVYLDNASSGFAARIELLERTEDVGALMADMYRNYCRLVKKHSMKDYSPPVQKAIACIDGDLTSNLSLRTLSEALNISSSYLSTLFKKETGQTITDFINGRRVNHAKHLLRNTRLQIQTVAQHCGIMDVHYFSKIFKKHTGKTPKEYRETSKR